MTNEFPYRSIKNSQLTTCVQYIVLMWLKFVCLSRRYAPLTKNVKPLYSCTSQSRSYQMPRNHTQVHKCFVMCTSYMMCRIIITQHTKHPRNIIIFMTFKVYTRFVLIPQTLYVIILMYFIRMSCLIINACGVLCFFCKAGEARARWIAAELTYTI